MSTNVCTLGGRIGKMPEIRYTPAGKSVGVFSIAVDRGYGEKKRTVWANVEVWDKTAEAVARMARPGGRVIVTGEFDEDSWTDKEGNKKSRPKFIAKNVDIIDFVEKQDDGPSEDAPF